MTDGVLMALLVLSFATFCTVHVAMAAALGLRGPWWRGALSLVVAPLALYWGLRENLRKRSLAWVGSLAVYIAANVAARAVRGH